MSNAKKLAPTGCYLATLPREVLEAATRVFGFMAGADPAWVWSDDNNRTDLDRKEQDYKLLAAQHDWLRSSKEPLTYEQKAEIWVKEFIETIESFMLTNAT
jgi:hypothetical protein